MSEVEAVEAVTTTADTHDVPAQETDWKAAARKWEARAKENSSAAAKLASIEEASKTEAQKLQEQLAVFQERAASAERDRERLAVIAKHGIPSEFHDLVHGSDPEALEASAAKVKSLIQTTSQPQQAASFVIPDEGNSPHLALNGDGLEAALKNALNIK
ncbi:capsid assembly scaffolding protein Gp46 family protein [Arthrobacter sp. MDT1-65]